MGSVLLAAAHVWVPEELRGAPCRHISRKAVAVTFPQTFSDAASVLKCCCCCPATHHTWNKGPLVGCPGPPDTADGEAPEMRHDDLLGEDVLQEEADNVRQVVMETARPQPEKLLQRAVDVACPCCEGQACWLRTPCC